MLSKVAPSVSSKTLSQPSRKPQGLVSWAYSLAFMGLSQWGPCMHYHVLSLQSSRRLCPKQPLLCYGQDRVCGRDGLQVTAAWEGSVVGKATSLSGWRRVPVEGALPLANTGHGHKAVCQHIKKEMRLWGWTRLVLQGGKFLSELRYIYRVRITASAPWPCWAVCKEQEEESAPSAVKAARLCQRTSLQNFLVTTRNRKPGASPTAAAGSGAESVF